jgi:lysophospholipase L1-like esterase
MMVGASAGGLVTDQPANALIVRQWVGAWSVAHSVPGVTSPVVGGLNNQSVRMVMRTSISGESIRIRLANTHGDRHQTIAHTTVGLPETATPNDRTDIEAASIRDVTFGGSTSVFITKGSEVLSDPIPIAVAAFQELVISLYVPAPTGPPTFHSNATALVYGATGDMTASPSGTAYTTFYNQLFFLGGVDVLTRKALGSVAVIGDSIVDGAFSTFNGYTRWTDRLAERLQAERPLGPIEIGVLNQGIGGNQLTFDGLDVPPGIPGQGPNGLSRLDRDVFGQPGVRAAFVCLGLNDLLTSNFPAERIITGLRQAAAQVRAKDLIAIGCTITPFEGFPGWTPEKEANRQAVNAFLRGSDDFNTVVDFDAVVRDPARPSRLLPTLDSGDHIHPNPTGYTAMGDAIPLRIIG